MKMNTIPLPLNTLPDPDTNRLHLLGSRTSLFLAILLSLLALAMPAWATGSSGLVIAEAYGGGGNSGAPYQNDFVVLFNRGTSPVDVNGWSIQYASATGSSWNVATIATSSTIIPSGGYFLVKLAGGATGSPLPTPDSIPTTALNLSGSAGKVALVSSTTPLSGTCPTGGSIVDFIGYGTTANCYEGSAAAPVLNNTLSAQRNSGGCIDTDNNSLDFIAAAPNPRNSATPLNVCPAAIAPSIVTQPQSQTRLLTETAVFTVVATGTAPLTYQWYKGSTALANDAQTTGATSNTLTIANLTFANAADYTVVVQNSVGSATSSPPATLSVINPLPTLFNQPLSQTVLLGTTIALKVAAYGVPPFTYRWQKDGVDLADGGQVSGSSSSVLTIANLDYPNAGDYTVNVTCSGGSVASQPATVGVTNIGVLAGWDFNGAGLSYANPLPSKGSVSATAALAGTTNGFLPTGGSALDPVNSVPGATNYYWGTASYPAQGTGNKSNGVRFNVSTVGMRNVTVTFDTRASATASRYQRLQYTTNGTDFIDFPVSSSFSSATIWESRAFSLVGFPGVRDNPNFGLRIVSEFQSTATYGLSNSATYLAAGPTSSYATSGTLSYDLVTISAETITNANTPPVVSGIADVSMLDTDPSATVNFTASGSGPLTVTAAAANPNVVGSINASLTGTSGTLTISPGGMDGVSPVWVTVTDIYGDSTVASLNVTVNPPNLPPVITQLPHTNTLVNTALTIPFTIGDDSPVAGLTLSKASASQALVPDANILFGGSGSNRSVTITPATGAVGLAPITLTVTDSGGKSASTSFTLMVRPSTNVVFNDFFDYPDGWLVSGSFNLWNTHSGTPGQMDVTGGLLNITANESEDCNAPLIGQPYSTNSPVVLYSSFVVNYSVLPTQGGAYFAHFKDAGTGANSGFGARVWASTVNAADGYYRLGIANGDGGTNTTAQFPMDLALGSNYTVVTRFVLSNGVATLWINPSYETSQSVTADDVSNRPADINNPINVTSYAFRQALGEGTLTVDNLKIGLAFNAVIPVVVPQQIPLNIAVANGNAVLSWSDPAFSLASSTDLAGTYNKIPGATSPYTNAISGSTKFFRLVWP